MWDEIIGEMEGASGPGCIRFFHLNDSKTPLGSSVDRHWHIGKGEIGTGCFRFLLNDERLAHLGGVMETPKMGKMDEENMTSYEVATFSSGVSSFFLAFCTYASASSSFST